MITQTLFLPVIFALTCLPDNVALMADTQNHVTSKRIVNFASQYPNPVIVLEDLTGIRENTKHRKAQLADFHSWAFYQLQEFIAYKALALGIPTVRVDPRNTSKSCSRCGAIGKRDKHNFTCACGYHDHSDRNASRNIALRFVVRRQVELDDDGLQSISPEVSGVEAEAGLSRIEAEPRDKLSALAVSS